jgi:hypothetical protein
MKFIKLALATLLSSAVMLAPATVMAATVTSNSLCNGTSLNDVDDANCKTSPKEGEKTVKDIATDVINIFSWIVGIISVIMIIYGGFRYITSGGNDAGVKAAKNTILYAVVGLIIVALAQIIVKFVINKFS